MPAQTHCPKPVLYSCLALSLLLLLLPGPARAATPWLGLDHSREHTIREPVFQGTAYVYEAGIGHKQSVVLVHGIGDHAARDWKHLIPLLAKRYHVVTFDLPGFGRSEKGNKLYSPERYVAFVNYIVRQYTDGPIYLIGHSMGGAISTRYASTFPREVKRLVLIDVAGILNGTAYTKFLLHLGVNMVPGMDGDTGQGLQNFAGDILRRMGALEQPAELVLLSPRTRQRLLQGMPSRIAGFALVADDFSEYIRRVQADTLIIWGGKDKIAPVRTGMLLAANIPDARLKILKLSEHVPMLDDPERLNPLVLEHLGLAQPALEALQRREYYALPADGSNTSRRIGRCTNRDKATFTGNYHKIIIRNCRRVYIHEARIGSLEVVNARVRLENSRVRSDGTAIKLKGARLQVTGGSIRGDIGIRANSGQLDLAGTEVSGKRAAIYLDKAVPKPSLMSEPARLLFSVTRIDSPYFSGYKHGLVSENKL